MTRKYGDEFKRQVLKKMFDGQAVVAVSREIGVAESLTHKWKREALKNGSNGISADEIKEVADLKKRDRELEMENEILSGSLRDLRARKLVRYGFIDQEKARYLLNLLCRVMEVSMSGHYRWRNRLTKQPCLKRKQLADLIKDCYWENRRRYGTRRMGAAFAKSGVKVGRFFIRRIMDELNLKAIAPKRFVPKTTDSCGTASIKHDFKLRITTPKKCWNSVIIKLQLVKMNSATVRDVLELSFA